MKAEKRIIATMMMLMTDIFLNAQNGGNSFGRVSLTANNTGMYILGGWAIANWLPLHTDGQHLKRERGISAR